MAASISVHLQIFKRPQLLHFSIDLGETGIKIHGLSRSFIYNMLITKIAVPFNISIVKKTIYAVKKGMVLSERRAKDVTISYETC